MPEEYTINNGTLYINTDDGDAIPLGGFAVERPGHTNQFDLWRNIDQIDHILPQTDTYFDRFINFRRPPHLFNADDESEPIEQPSELLDDFLNGFMITNDDIRR